MKKLSLALVAALSLSTAAFAENGPTPGSDGQIKFTGTVTEAGCTIIAGNSATVDLGSIGRNTLEKKTYGNWGTGQVKLVDCNLDVVKGAELKTVSITIQPGSPATSDNKLWANNGDATGVAIEVEVGGDKGLSQVTPAGTTDAIEAKIDPVNGTATYQVRGRMVGSDDVTPGSVETTVSFVASYK